MAAETAHELNLTTAARQRFDTAINTQAYLWETGSRDMGIRDMGVALNGANPKVSARPWITCLSGGADSTALALLAEDHARRTARAHSAIIIDHGIRPEAAREAARVGRRIAGAVHDRGPGSYPPF